MPPRKSNVSTASNGAEDGAEPAPGKGNKDGMSVEDLSLPKSMIARLAKGVLPANTQIHKDALLAMHKSATVFVNYIASTSFEYAQLSNKKTIMPPDVMAALKDAELENFLPRLEAELKKYNDIQCDKRNNYRKKVKEDKAVVASPNGEGGDGDALAEVAAPPTNGAANGHIVEDEERPAKKQKGDEGTALPPDPDAMDEDLPDNEQEDIPDDVDQEEDDEDEAESDSASVPDANEDDAMYGTVEEAEERERADQEYQRALAAGDNDSASDSD